MINSLITEYDLSGTYIVYLSIIKRTMTDDTIEFFKQ